MTDLCNCCQDDIKDERRVMSDRQQHAEELLRRVLVDPFFGPGPSAGVDKDIRAYLAEPQPMTTDEMLEAMQKVDSHCRLDGDGAYGWCVSVVDPITGGVLQFFGLTPDDALRAALEATS